MLFEVLKDGGGNFCVEKIDGWRNNPECVKLLNVKSESEAREIVRGMNAASPQAEIETPPQAGNAASPQAGNETPPQAGNETPPQAGNETPPQAGNAASPQGEVETSPQAETTPSKPAGGKKRRSAEA